jgi:hypothetical protein
MMPDTEFEFCLPKGLIDSNGGINRQGAMRLATGHDEIYVYKNRRVRENSAYSSLVMLSRVITQLGTLTTLSSELLEQLFLIDFIYLQEFFTQINPSPLGLSTPGE